MQHVAFGTGTGTAVVGIVGIVDDGNAAEVSWRHGRHGHGRIDSCECPSCSAVRIWGDLAVAPADIQPAQTIQPAQKFGVHIVMKAVAVALYGGSSRTGGRHKVGLVHGHEKIFAGNFCALHFKGRHVVFGIGGVEILKTQHRPILKRQQQVVTRTGKRGLVGGEVKNKTAVRRAGDVLRSLRFGLGKTYIGHGSSCISSKKKARERRAGFKNM